MELAQRKEAKVKSNRSLREKRAQLKRLAEKQARLDAQIKEEEVKPPKYTRKWTEDLAWMTLHKGVKLTKNKLLVEAVEFLREVYLRKDLTIARARRNHGNGNYESGDSETGG